MKCKNCGTELKEGTVFCSNCGTRLLVEGLRCKEETQFEIKNDTTNTKKKPKKKKDKGCLGCLINIFIFIGVIFLGLFSINQYKIYSYNKYIKEALLVDKNEIRPLTEQERKEDWNNDGISNGEAEKLGLNITVLDSDGDGLSDKDEINIYKTDPLKYSTSGDIYSDGYKVFYGYDLKVKYDTIKIVDTTNPRVKLEVNSAENMKAYYKDYNGAIPDKFYLGFQPFKIFSFKGEVDVTLDNPNDFDVYSYNEITNMPKLIKSKVENNTLVFKIEDDNPILIVYKKSVLDKMDPKSVAYINSIYTNNVNQEYFIFAVPLVTKILNHPVYVLEIDNGIIKGGSDQAFMEEINSKTNGKYKVEHYYTNDRGINFIEKMLGMVSSEIYSNVGEENKSFVNYMIYYKRVSSKNELFKVLDIEFGDSSEELDEDINNFDDKYSNKKCAYCADSGFKVDVNAFRFKNLSTTTSPGGVCAGFSYITTNIYNQNNLAKSIDNVYNMDDENYSNIWNRNLYNYLPTDKALIKYSDGKKNNEDVLDPSKMSKPDSEVVKALNYYWETSNKEMALKKFGWAWNNSNDLKSYINEKSIQNLLEQFRNGKIATAILLSDSQHAINVYKIVEDVDDPDILYLKAYDNNFPNDSFFTKDSKKIVKKDITITLKRVYETHFHGTYAKYTYSYNPIGSDSYNYSTLNDTFDGILFLDENNKVL